MKNPEKEEIAELQERKTVPKMAERPPLPYSLKSNKNK
jgi:hypothetical protein